MSKANQTTSRRSKSRRPTALSGPEADEPVAPPFPPPWAPPPAPPFLCPPPWEGVSPPCSLSCPAASMQRKMTWGVCV